jgi:Flp pilus assembly CpaF family ATPase
LEEIEAWTLHRTSIGLRPPSVTDEDVLADAVVASLSGLGRLEPLLRREDVEDIFFAGTAPTMLRLTDGRKVPAPPIAASDQELIELIQRLATALGDGVSREFSAARPLLAVRLQPVGNALGSRLNAGNDITPHPAGTIRIHHHVEGDLDLAYRLGMIDAPLRAFLRAAVRRALASSCPARWGRARRSCFATSARSSPSTQ